MKTVMQIEKEINKRLSQIEKYKVRGYVKNNIVGTINKMDIYAALYYIHGMGFVLGQKERMLISEKTRERLLKATKEFRNG